MLLDINEYSTLVKHLLSDKSKFRTVENDATFIRLDSLKNYFRKLKAHNDILQKVYKRICSISARGHVYPNYTKICSTFPSSDKL